MSTNTKRLIIFIAVVAVLSGLFSFLTNRSVHFAFSWWKKPGEISNTYPIKDRFNEVEIETDTARVTILPASDGKAKAVRTGNSRNSFEIKTSGKKLTISDKDKRPWIFRIGTYTGKSEITVYLPDSAYKSLTAKSATGSIELRSGFSFEDVDLKSDTGSISISSANISDNLEIKSATGRVSLSDIRTDDLNVKTATGGISLKNVIAAEEMNIKSDTGSVELDRCDGQEISIKTDTGSVRGTLRTGKIFSVKSDLGRVSVPESGFGGNCKIESDTGSITIEISGK